MQPLVVAVESLPALPLVIFARLKFAVGRHGGFVRGIVMRHMIGARGILVGSNDAILLALEQITPGEDEFWVLPGGRLEPEDSSVVDCVRREFREETGLTVKVGPLLYVGEFSEPSRQTHHLGVCFLVHSPEGDLYETNPDEPLQGAELRRHVRWFTQAELQTLRVYPEELRDGFWRDRAAGVTQVQYLGVAREEAPDASD
jgi:8-oxo-dGTP diphosphatase